MVAFDCEWTPGSSSKLTVIILSGSIPIANSMEREDVTVVVSVYHVQWASVTQGSDESLLLIKQLFANPDQNKSDVHHWQ
eukprot:m.93184 g.93184  ORF g.93184 m.93184 type:complete len:80 (+) comp14976_c0_seq6:820-1059(+)